MKKKHIMLISVLSMLFVLCACGKGKETVEPSTEDSKQGQPGDENLDWLTDFEKYVEHFNIEVPELDSPKDEVPENVVVMWTTEGNYMNHGIFKQVDAFNQTENDIKVKIKFYEDTDSMMLDFVREPSCDLLVLSPSYLTTLSDKGGLEDLSPYLEKSEKVSREELFNVALEAGTAGGKLAGILPGFTVDAILVENGYTEDGGWTIEEYLALADKHPDVPLSVSQNATGWLMTTLHALPESFVNWEERSCSFESEDFIRSLEMVKDYAKRSQKPGKNLTLVEMLYGDLIQTATVEISYEEYFENYQDIRDAFLGDFELAGYPNKEGEVRYPMAGLMRVLYCMNASSTKKEAAWIFLEYMLSEYQAAMMDGRSEEFPVRRDIVESKLQEEIEAELTDKYFRMNFYNREMVPKRGNFTEEDKERVLYILDHASPPTVLQGGAFWSILNEELDAYFAGDKTAAETARIIQNRVTTYLSE